MKSRVRPDWLAGAEELARRFPRERLHAATVAWMEARSKRERWSIAFSGGADSVALLLLLWAHWPGRRAKLRALHFDHRLRGKESRADATFCRRVCRALDVDLIEDRWQAAPAEASEAEARAARMAFFRKHARIVFLGHQQDDVAESMLMRLARGSGAGGLAAPRPVQIQPRGRIHVRPLLDLKKAELIAALRSVGLPWCEDATNRTDRFLRNRVRTAVLGPWNKAAGRDALAGAARSRTLLEEDDDALERWLDELQPLADDRTLDLQILAKKPRALLRRALHRWLLSQPQEVDVSRQAFDALLSSITTARPTRHSLGAKGLAVIRDGRLRFELHDARGRKFGRSAN